MSVSHDGRLLKCDGPDCAATARPPVALRSTLGQVDSAPQDCVYGWLYVVREGQWSHFCPGCNTAYLESMALSDGGMRSGL